MLAPKKNGVSPSPKKGHIRSSTSLQGDVHNDTMNQSTNQSGPRKSLVIQEKHNEVLFSLFNNFLGILPSSNMVCNHLTE
jgi:hypothetical protein